MTAPQSAAQTSQIGPEEIAHYEEHGYVVVPGLFDAERLAPLRQRMDDIIGGRVEPAEHMLVMKDVMVAKKAIEVTERAEAIAKLQDFEADPVLYGYVLDEPMLDCVEALIGEGVQSIHTMAINKPPNVDGRHPLHQDIIYFPFRPPERIVATWTALEPVTRENGCLVGIPGSHKGEIHTHELPDWEHVNLGYVGVSGIGADDRRVHFELDPGDTIFFHPLLVHGSGRNKTQGFRRAISAHYASLACETDPKWADFLPQRHYTPIDRSAART